jgi:hypothetical protein
VRRIAVVLGALLTIGVISAPARSFTSGIVFATLNEAGGGSLIANGGGNPPNQTWSWQICNAAGERCSAVATGQHIETGAPSAGTTFRATSNAGITGLSPEWNGPLRVASPPSATGALQANQLLTPVPAAWEGGWTGDSTQTQMSLCPTAAGVGCIAPLERFSGSCPADALTIDPDFTGWWLRVATTVYGPDTAFATLDTATQGFPPPAFAAQALVSPSGYGTEAGQAAAATTSVAVVGRIGRATGPRARNCGPPALVPELPPLVALRVRSATVDGDGIAFVKCSWTCTVSLNASRRGRFASVMKTAQGEIQLRIPGRGLARVGRGRVRYTLFVEGHRAAQRTVGT